MAASLRAVADPYLGASVLCMCIIIFFKQDVSKTT